MLAILFIVLFFRRKAQDFQMSAWLWSILGIVVYYIVQLGIGLIIMGFFPTMYDNDFLIMLIGILFGALGVYGLYLMMKQKAKEVALRNQNSDLLDN